MRHRSLLIAAIALSIVAGSLKTRNGDTTAITQWVWHQCSGPKFR